MPHRVFVGHAETRGDTVFLFSSPRSDGIFLVSNTEAGTDAFEISSCVFRRRATIRAARNDQRQLRDGARVRPRRPSVLDRAFRHGTPFAGWPVPGVGAGVPL